MKMLVLGAGRMGLGAAFDLAAQPDVESVTVADMDGAKARQVATRVGAKVTPVQIDGDEALATALNLRLDLMNERGALADSWRLIKLAADELKSILKLQASQQLGLRQ